MISEYDQLFGNLAVSKGFINQNQLQQCLQYISTQSTALDLELLFQQQGFLTTEQVTAIKSELSGTESTQISSTDATTTLPPISQTQIIANRYTVIEEIGAGGMGRVYKAHDQQLNRIVALKMLLSSSSKEQDIERFFREARAMASLAHRNILNILDLGLENKQPFFTMDYVEGNSLKDLEKSLSTRQVVQIMIKVCQGVDYAHKQGVIHRDLKPSNIMLDKNKEPKIMDFGLAKLSKEDKKLSKTGMIMGTLQYMPPEQTTGHSSMIDERSDVYSLGAVIYEMLTGLAPFGGASSLNIIYQISEKEVRFSGRMKSLIPQNLQNICLKAMEKKKERRYQSAAKLGEDLKNFLQGKDVSAQSLGFPGTLWRKIERNKITSIALLVAISSLLGLLFLWANATKKILIKSAIKKTSKSKEPDLKIILPQELQKNDSIRLKGSRSSFKLKVAISSGPGIKVSINQKKEKHHTAINKEIELEIELNYGPNNIELQIWANESWKPSRKLHILREFPKDTSMWQTTGAYPLGGPAKIRRYSWVHRVDSPINVINRMLYYGYHEKDSKEGILIARNGSFKKQWVYPVPSRIYTFPLVVGDFVYFGTNAGNFYALKTENNTPKLLWKKETKYPIRRGSLTFSEGVIYFNNSLTCYALDMNSGKKIWAKDFSLLASLAILKDRLYIGDEKALYALDKKTGNKIWSTPTTVKSFPTIAENKIFYHSSTSAYAVDLHSGKVLWKRDLEIVQDQQRKFFNSALFSKQTLYWVVSFSGNTENSYSCLCAIDSKTGIIKWQSKLNSPSQSAPIMAGDTIYIGANDGIMYAINAKNGQHIFRFRLQSKYRNNSIRQPAVVENNTIYIGARFHITSANLAVIKKIHAIRPILANSFEGEHFGYSGNRIKATSMDIYGSWSNGRHLGWRPKRVEEKLLGNFSVAASGIYKIWGHFTKNASYGKHRILINSIYHKSTDPEVDLYSKKAMRTKPIYLGKHELKQGHNTFVVECRGKNKLSKNLYFGLDNIILENTSQRPRTQQVAYYPFDGDYKDYSKNNNHAKVKGKISFTKGVVGNAIHFDGNSWLTVKDSASLDLTQAFTFSLWLYAPKRNILVPILSKADNPFSSYRLLFSHSGKYPMLQLWPKKPHRLYAMTPLPFDSWYMLSVTYNGLWAKFYINGSLKHSIYFNTKMRITHHDLLIGFSNHGKYRNKFIGKMDELRIYNYALSKRSIKQLYSRNKKGIK